MAPRPHLDLSDYLPYLINRVGSALVTRLVDMGLVSRTRSTRSNREVVVDLTPKAAALVAQLIPIAEELQATATQGLSKQELAHVKRALRRMHENLTRA